MKKILFISLMVILVSALFLGSCTESTPASQEVIKLTSSNYLPIAHLFTPLQEAWGKEIMARSNGRVEITY
jgi:TRAP-type C4-dicarboxylate transport system substrate-binding protein